MSPLDECSVPYNREALADTEFLALNALKERGWLHDGELASMLGVGPEVIKQVIRSLTTEGYVGRFPGKKGKFVTALTSKALTRLYQHRPDADPPTGERLSEDQVKRAVATHLESGGWTVQVAWGRTPGIDIEARRRGERLVIEAKGEAGLQPQQHNYFVGALGELVQRLDEPNARYGLALPNHRQYHGLVDRLPDEAKKRLNFIVFWVERGPDGPRVTSEPPPTKGNPAW